jgi:hypothetical protein
VEQAKMAHRERRGLPFLETLGRMWSSACGCCGRIRDSRSLRF